MPIFRPLPPIFCALGLLAFASGNSAAADNQAPPSKIVHPGPDGKLVYEPDAQGNTIPDFSNCGYMGGGVALPQAPVRLTIQPVAGDNRAHIQNAIDKIAAMQPDADGFRGALLLKKGRYPVEGTLKINGSGIVLRGEGHGSDDTVLIATQRKQHDLLQIMGGETRQRAADLAIADEYVPVGARRFHLENATGLAVGDDIEIMRPSTAEWIHDIAMDRIQASSAKAKVENWKPGRYNLRFDRRIAAIRNNEIEIDAPLGNAFEKKYGGGVVRKYTQPGQIARNGVENIRADSVFDPAIRDPKRNTEYADENHAWRFIVLRNAENCWVRDVTAIHFGYACVEIQSQTRWITVQDCRNLEPVSIVTGARRYSFGLKGNLALVQRCYCERGRHDYVMHSLVPGPNVFLDCVAVNAFDDTGPHHRWSVATLYDNLLVKGNRIRIQDRGDWGSGHGWAGANQVVWNCESDGLVVQKPPTAQNWAIGCIGPKQGERLKGRPDGYWESHNAHVTPRSLYLKQLEDRLGPEAVRNVTTEVQRKGSIYEELKTWGKQ